MNEQIKKDIFVAIISSGSNYQKENWRKTADEAYRWVISQDEQVARPRQTKAKADKA
jgi:hypothetical protein